MGQYSDETASSMGVASAVEWVRFEVETSLATLGGARHTGLGPTVLFLHGLGSSSGDIASAAQHEELGAYRIEAIDLPGHRSSRWRKKDGSDAVLACVDLAAQYVADHIDGELAIVGHSLGGAIGVLLADRLGDQCRGFIDIEGNLVASDCGDLSRPTAGRNDWEREELFEMIDEHVRSNPVGGTEGFLDRYRANVTDHRAWMAYTTGLIHHSTNRSLFDRFMALDCWRSYIYGADNPPEVVEQLVALGVPATPIQGSGHWPMYARPNVLHDAIAHDLRQAFAAESM